MEASTETDGDAAWYIADQQLLQRYNYHNGYLEGMPDKALGIAGIELSLGIREEKPAQPIKSVVMYATGDSVVAGLVPATSRRCCGRVSICEIIVSASAFFSSRRSR